jgi:hypothetical protein
MICPNCHQALADGAQFCAACGTKIDAVPAAAMAGAGASAGGAAAAAPAWAVPGLSPGLIARVKNMLLTPKTEWQVIAPEPTTVAQAYTGYVIPMAAFAGVMSFLHMSVVGVQIPFGGSMRMPVMTGLTSAVVSFIGGMLGLYLVGLIINALAPTFSGTKDQRQAMKVAAYAFTPAWIGTLLALSPVAPGLLQFLAGCYGIYVLALGLPVLMLAPRDKAFGYTASVVVCTILIGIVLGFVLGAVGVYGHGGFMGSRMGATGDDAGAAAVSNVIGNALGTDEQGKAGLTAALSNMAKVGEAQRRAAAVQAAAAPAAAGSRSSAADAAPDADSTQAALGAAGGLMAALGGALNGGKHVDAVDFKTLESLLPDSVAGMPRTHVSGENTTAVGVKSSNAKAQYRGDGGLSGEVEIADMSGVAGLMDLANGMQQTSSSESDTGFEKDVMLGGRRAHEKYDNGSRHGEVAVTVAKRYVVTVSGTGVEMASLEKSVGAVDLARLESMKDLGAHP